MRFTTILAFALASFISIGAANAHPTYPDLDRSTYSIKRVPNASKFKAVTVRTKQNGTVKAVRSYDIVKRRAVRPAHEMIYKSARGGASKAVSIAKKYIGTNPTRMRSLWCANFLGMIEKKAGRPGLKSNFARSYADYGSGVKKSQAREGDIVVLARGKRGGHVGYFLHWDNKGRAVLVSGNTRGSKVGISAYAPSRIIAIRRA